MIRKYLDPIVCYLFGHDKYFPHPNKEIWYCARCENSPRQQYERSLWSRMEEKK